MVFVQGAQFLNCRMNVGTFKTCSRPRRTGGWWCCRASWGISAQIDHVTIGESGKPVLDVCTETGNWYGPLEAGEFYLTSQEAEEELRKEGENG